MLSLPLALALFFPPQLPAEWVPSFLGGSRALEQGELESARASFERVQALLPGHGPSAYQLACVLARAGEPELALGALERAGQLDPALLRWDADLDSLRGEARFAALLGAGAALEPSIDRTDAPLRWVEEARMLAVSPDGVGGLTDRGELLDLLTGELVARLALPSNWIRSAVFDPQGRWLACTVTGASGPTGCSLRVFDPTSGDLLREIGGAFPETCLRTNAKGSRLMLFKRRLRGGAPRAGPVVWDTASWTLIDRLSPSCTEAFLTPDGRRAVLEVPRDGGMSDVVIWSVGEGVELARHREVATSVGGSVGLSPSGELAWAVDRGKERVLWFDTSTGVQVRTEDGRRPSIAATGPVEEPRRVDPVPEEAVVEPHPERAIAWLGNHDGLLRELDVESGFERRCLRVGDDAIVALQASADGARLALLDVAGGLRWIATEELAVLSELALPELRSNERAPPVIDLAPEGTAALIAGRDSLTLVDLEAGAVVRSFPRTSPYRRAWAWGPRGERFALADTERGIVQVHAAADGSALGRVHRTPGPISAVAFEPIADRLWIGTTDTRVRVLEIETGAELRSFSAECVLDFDPPAVEAIAFDPSARTAITATDGWSGLAAWDLATGERRWTFEIGYGSSGRTRVEFWNEELVYVDGSGRTSDLIDARDGARLHELYQRGGSRLHPVVGAQRVLSDGSSSVDVIELASGARPWRRFELPDSNWLLRSQAQFVDGSAGALEQLHVQLDGRTLRLDALAAALLDPKKARASAGGLALAPPQLGEFPRLDWRERPPRVLLLGADEAAPSLALFARSDAGLLGVEQRVGDRTELLAGTPLGDGSLHLEVELERAPPGETRSYRWRALGANGLLGRSIHLTVRGR